MGTNSSRSELSSVYKVLRNIKPAVGCVVTNMMNLCKSTNPAASNSKSGTEDFGRIAEDFVLECMNHPSSKAVLCNILKKLLMDTSRQNANLKLILSGN